MSRRPIYMKNKNKSYWLIFLMLVVIGWIFFGYDSSSVLNSLVDNSKLKGRTFQGVVEEITSDKGRIKAYFIEEKDSPLVSISFIFSEAGVAYDPKGKEGLAKLVSSSMLAGSQKMSSEELSDYTGIKGINISFSASMDSFTGQMTASKENFSDAISVLHQVLISPRYERKYVENNKDVMIKSLKVEKESPAKELNLAFNELIYGDYPYGRNPLGDIKAIESITRDDLKAFVKNNLSKSNLFVGIAGNISKDEAIDALKKIFGDLAIKNKTSKLEFADIDWAKSKISINRENAGQNIASFAVKGTCRKCDDFYPLYIANYLFGGSGLNSKLNQKIREQEGLTYGGYSGLVLLDNANLITAGFSATPDKYAKAEKLFKQEWINVCKNGFNETDLKSAKKYLTSSYNLRFASTIGIAEMLAYMQKYDLGLDFLQKRNQYVEEVTLEQLNRVSADYFTENMLQAEIGSFNKGEN